MIHKTIDTIVLEPAGKNLSITFTKPTATRQVITT